MPSGYEDRPATDASRFEVVDRVPEPVERVRAEIVRCLTEPGATVVRAAAELGIGRATLYRKIAQYDLTVPRAGT